MACLFSSGKVVTQTSVGQTFYTGHQLSTTYAYLGAGIFREWTDNPNDMTNEIINLVLQNVSRHTGDPNVLNVLDIAPNTISNRRDFIQESRNQGVFILTPPTDPAFHLEIRQHNNNDIMKKFSLCFSILICTACNNNSSKIAASVTSIPTKDSANALKQMTKPSLRLLATRPVYWVTG